MMMMMTYWNVLEFCSLNIEGFESLLKQGWFLKVLKFGLLGL